MAKKSKGKHRLDKFYYLAKEQGFRSRAAFKLIQLNRKYDFLGKSRAVLDLCAAPGGWLQVAAKHMPVSSLIIGVDLAPIKPIRGVKTFIGDITTQKCRQQLKKEANGALMDCVLHDGAPNVGGAWSSEAYTQSNLVLESLKLATEFLAPNGTFVTKVFRSKDYTSLLFAFNQLFNKVEATKPVASRTASAEIFVVCLGYKAPAKIDPRLLDPRHLFQEVHELAPNAGPQALLKHKIKKQRHREGYIEGISTTHKATSAAAFVLGDNPVEMLGNYTKFILEGPGCTEGPPPPRRPSEEDGPSEEDAARPPVDVAVAQRVAAHATTTAEVKTLCGDLQVLGRSEFKLLLKWRLKLRKELDVEAKAAAKAAAGAAGATKAVEAQIDGLTEDEKMLLEMAEMKEKLELQRKKDRRRRHELKMKARVRAAQMARAEGIADTGAEEDLFTLSALKGKDALDALHDAAAPDDDALELLEAPSSSDAGLPEHSEDDPGSDADSEEEARRYDDNLNQGFEDAFQSYLVRQKLRKEAAEEAAAAKKRKRLHMDGELAGQEQQHTDGEDQDLVQPAEDEEEAGAGLLVALDEQLAGRPATAAAQAAQWFSQDFFNDPLLVGEVDEDPAGNRRHKKQCSKGGGVASSAHDEDLLSDEGTEGDAGPMDDLDEDLAEAAAVGRKGKVLAGFGTDMHNSKAQFTALQSAVEPKIGSRRARRTAASAAAGHRFDSDSEDAGGSDGSGAMSSGDDKGPGALLRMGAGVKRARDDDGDDIGGDAGFEVVTAAAERNSDEDSSSDSEQEFENLDDKEKVEIRAIAKRMLRARGRNDILEASYNRYAFNDEDELPMWFVMDEKKHTRPAVELTRQELDDAKQALKAVDARPIKKVAEARARKRKRMAVKLTAAKQKAEAIAGQEDMPAASKMKEIEKVMAKARASGKGKSGKAVKGRGKGKKGPPLDRRMLADKRQVNMKSKQAAAKKKKRKASKSKARKSRA